MNIKKINMLEKRTFEEFGGRKEKSRLDLVGCISNSHVTFYGVPRNIEHLEFIPEIKKHFNYEQIIPVQLRFNKDYTEIERSIFGVSSYETKHKIKHGQKHKKRVIEATTKFAEKSGFSSIGSTEILDYDSR